MFKFEGITKFTELHSSISTKKEGNMSFAWGNSDDVLKNRKIFFLRSKIDPNVCVAMRTSNNMNVVTVGNTGKTKGIFNTKDAVPADALITTEKNLYLFLLIADCAPIVFYDQKEKVLGLAHVNRINYKIIEKVVEKFKNSYKSSADNIFVSIGPSIKKESFKFKKSFVEKLLLPKQFTRQLSDGYISIDMVGLIENEIKLSGVPKENVFISKVDTFRETNLFSHYREIRRGDPEGRFAVIVGMR